MSCKKLRITPLATLRNRVELTKNCCAAPSILSVLWSTQTCRRFRAHWLLAAHGIYNPRIHRLSAEPGPGLQPRNSDSFASNCVPYCVLPASSLLVGRLRRSYLRLFSASYGVRTAGIPRVGMAESKTSRQSHQRDSVR